MSVEAPKVSKKLVVVLLIAAFPSIIGCYYLISCGLTAMEDSATLKITGHGDDWQYETVKAADNSLFWKLLKIFIYLSLSAYVVWCLYFCVSCIPKEMHILYDDKQKEILKLMDINLIQKISVTDESTESTNSSTRPDWRPHASIKESKPMPKGVNSWETDQTPLCPHCIGKGIIDVAGFQVKHEIGSHRKICKHEEKSTQGRNMYLGDTAPTISEDAAIQTFPGILLDLPNKLSNFTLQRDERSNPPPAAVTDSAKVVIISVPEEAQLNSVETNFSDVATHEYKLDQTLNLELEMTERETNYNPPESVCAASSKMVMGTQEN